MHIKKVLLDELLLIEEKVLFIFLYEYIDG